MFVNNRQQLPVERDRAIGLKVAGMDGFRTDSSLDIGVASAWRTPGFNISALSSSLVSGKPMLAARGNPNHPTLY